MNKQNIAIGLIVGSMLVVSCSTGQSTTVLAPTATTAAQATATPKPAPVSEAATEPMTSAVPTASTVVDTSTVSPVQDATPHNRRSRQCVPGNLE